MRILAIACALFALATSTVAAANLAPVYYSQDRFQQTGNSTSTSPYINEATVTSPAAAASATCPAAANKILFMPASSAGNFRFKPNGSGVPNTPGTVQVTDGTGWGQNYGDWLDINVLASSTLIDHYSVWTAAADTVSYICGSK